MKKRCAILITLLIVVFMNACETQPISISNAYSPTHPSHLPYIDIGNATPSLTQSNTPQTPSTYYSPTPFASNTLFAPSTQVIIDTPTFSPSLTSIPTLQPGQGNPLINIHMMDASSGWGMEESGHIVHTEDGGVTFSSASTPSAIR